MACLCIPWLNVPLLQIIIVNTPNIIDIWMLKLHYNKSFLETIYKHPPFTLRLSRTVRIAHNARFIYGSSPL